MVLFSFNLYKAFLVLNTCYLLKIFLVSILNDS